MSKRQEQNYMSPEMEVVTIEVEQVILGSSIEEIGKYNDEIDW